MNDYYRSLAQVLMTRGSLVKGKSYYGGFNNYEDSIYKHANVERHEYGFYKDLKGSQPKCGSWKSLTDIDEQSSYVFAGTFVDSEEAYYVQGLLSCNCGEIEEANLVYDGTMSELIQYVVGEAPKINYLA
ncbi:hypothetical protein SEA_WEASELS2_91 [Rhodococcus phage Weasels2]|uniref:Uncharacterized protein n=1 Tax=Rhodococcus phage Weasels2 TaxID=1897437 RepID=A0A1I9SA74_9CAUD|nr:hypothetical protein FDH04_gp091 [Rhodococcus phage Weasels2]AOZ63680.1 hypothetical protein SEA_WEASELS2_91 [Rhodococcus phage Weasels2]